MYVDIVISNVFNLNKKKFFFFFFIVYRGKKIVSIILFVPFYLYMNEKYYEDILTSN